MKVIFFTFRSHNRRIRLLELFVHVQMRSYELISKDLHLKRFPDAAGI